ncbi:MAG: hypothetical protein EBX52_11480 [Proteobacteria bacterium]|nr:hypothetical protein [Pseudomonadota bacterium]
MLLFFSFFSALNSRADYFCSSESRFGGIQYSDASGTVLEVLDLQFDETRILGGYLACTRLIEQMPKEWNRTTTLVYLYPKSEQVVRLGPGDPLIDLCLQTPGCRLNPLFALFRPLATAKSILKPSLTRELPQCQEKPRRTEDDLGRSTPESAIRPVTVAPGRVIELPENNLEQEILGEIRSKEPSRILISTMILSAHILGEIDQWMVEHPEAEAWIFFSYTMQALEAGFPENFILKSKRIHLLPVFPTPDAEDSFHIKGMALEGKERGLWLYSVNLRRFREEKLIDRIFELKGGVAFDSFAKILESVLVQQCQGRRYAACTSELRFGAGTPRGKRIAGWVDDACAHPFPSPRTDEPLLFRGGVSSVENQILDWIKGAKKSIRVSSHILNDSPVSAELVRAKSRGVSIEILVGTESDGKWVEQEGAGFRVHYRTRETGGISHAKFMIFDDELAVWGTGNFTRTAMDNPWEIFLASRDPGFTGMLLGYFDKVKSRK